MHRLMPCRRQVNDGKATMGEANPTIRRSPDTAVVGASVHERVTATFKP